MIGCTAKHLGPQPYFVEIGHDFPAPLTDQIRADIELAALDALAALGLGWGPSHLELRLTPAGPRIIEVNPRLAGGMIPRLVLEATGIDLIELTVCRAAGMPVAIRPTRDRGSSIRFLLAAQPGTLLEVSGLELARSSPAIVEATLSTPIGAQLSIQNSFRDRLGYLIGTGKDGRAAAHAATEALAHLRLRIEAGNVPALSVAEGAGSQ